MIVKQWDRYETFIKYAHNLKDPLRDVKLRAIFYAPDGREITCSGFWDGEDIWRVRFMPDIPGHWFYKIKLHRASSSDPLFLGEVLEVKENSFECVFNHDDPPGPLGPDILNPYWFGFKSGQHILLRSFHVGDRFFAENWDQKKRNNFLEWLIKNKYNMISVASFFVNRNSPGRGEAWKTPQLWPINPEEYRKVEVILNELAEKHILVYPFAGIFGRSGYYPNEEREQILYIEYLLSRFGAYWNLMLNVAGPEPLLSVNPFMSKAEIDRLGYLIQRFNFFNLPLSVHNEINNNPFRYDGYISYSTIQGPKVIDRCELFSSIRRLAVPAMPLYAQETLWPGNCFGHPDYCNDDIRRNAIVLNMAAAAINFGDFNGDSSSGFSGTMEESDCIYHRHEIIGKVWDFFSQRPFYRMVPDSSRASSGICLFEENERLLAYIENGIEIEVCPGEGRWNIEWFNANSFKSVLRTQTTCEVQPKKLTAPYCNDWLVELVKI